MEVPLSDFELERLENIKRNQAVLESLGLGSPLGRPHKHRSDHTSQPRRAKKRKILSQEDLDVLLPERRRSRRHLGKEAPVYTEPPMSFERKSGRNTSVSGGEDDGDDDGGADLTMKSIIPQPPSEPAPGSSRGIAADVKGIQRFLGKKLDTTGKQAVVDLLCPTTRAKFSKYSGVLEWKNAVVLWVNADGGQYDNLFLKGGRHMTWFAGNRCTPETPVVQRLLRCSGDGGASKDLQAEDRDNDNSDGVDEKKGGEQGSTDEVLLFIRNTGEPYVFLGRLEAVEYQLRRHPIKMVWRLKDYEQVKDQPDFIELVGQQAK